MPVLVGLTLPVLFVHQAMLDREAGRVREQAPKWRWYGSKARAMPCLWRKPTNSTRAVETFLDQRAPRLNRTFLLMSSKVPTDSPSTTGATPRNDPGGYGRATGAPFASEATRQSRGPRGGADTEQARQALEELCRVYWRPIYAYLRRVGNAPRRAGFGAVFLRSLLNSGSLERVNPVKGRFRSFLLASLKHFMANEWDRARTLKRGGAVKFVSISAEDGDALAGLKDTSQPGPECCCDRQWALTLLERVLSRLESEFAAAGKQALWAQLRETLMSDRASVPSW